MKLSVCLITYNHEQFIAQALDSILQQKTSFDFEIVIGEDASTDSTRHICRQYADQHPTTIRLLPRQSNIGMMRNFMETFGNCRGEYIAFIEGDDYWTDPLKLETQVSFLENNKEFSLCFHNVVNKFMRINENAEVLFHKQKIPDIYETSDLLKQWFIPSSSVLLRSYPDFQLPHWFIYCKSGDIPFLLLISLRGKLKYIHQLMGVYRIHDAGISSTHNGYEKIISMIYIYENFDIHTGFKFHQHIRAAQQYEIDRHYPASANITGKPLIKNKKAKSVYKKIMVRLGL